jgi:phospholipase C
MDSATMNSVHVGNRANNWKANHAAWNGGHNDAWVTAKSPLTMGYYTRADLPYHYALADAFTICDNYRCSVMSATGANRTYLWSGTIDPGGRFGGPTIDGGHASGLNWTTYAERLQAAGVSWKVYHVDGDNFGDNGLAYFTRFSQAGQGDPLFDRGIASVAQVTGDSATDIALAIGNDARNRTLPTVSWVVGPPGTCEHPDYSPAAGADFIDRVLRALTSNPEAWASTVFLVNYDENDDFFDHAVPVTPPAGTPGEFIDGLPVGLGPRVPLLVISPWSRGGYVCSELFDHSSVLRFLERCTGVREPNISDWRRLVCGDLTSAFDFTRPALDVPVLPDTTQLVAQARRCGALPAPQPPALGAMPTQEPGTRPMRSLPYQPNTASRVNAAEGIFCIAMMNTGVRTVHFSVYDHGPQARGPWQYYALAKNASPVEHRFDVRKHGEGGYDQSVYGPNGFLRRFAGRIDADGNGVEAVASCDTVASGCKRLALDLINETGAAVTFTITANAHPIGGPWVHTLDPGQRLGCQWDVGRESAGWYDCSVTTDADASFLRRFAGHVEDA